LPTRGLCWSCYWTPGIREQFPSLSKFSQWCNEPTPVRSLVPVEPTLALPGSAEKIAVLTARFGQQQTLWHECDAVHSED
jgi:hypothetical protein